eukprot:s2133_g17.t1
MQQPGAARAIQTCAPKVQVAEVERYEQLLNACGRQALLALQVERQGFLVHTSSSVGTAEEEADQEQGHKDSRLEAGLKDLKTAAGVSETQPGPTANLRKTSPGRNITEQPTTTKPTAQRRNTLGWSRV